MLSLAQNYLTRGFWGDEAWTSMISQLPYAQMLKTTAADFHPPAYYTIIELVYKVFPPTEVVTRLVSIFFALLTVFAVYKLASGFKGRLFGLLSALVVLVNPIFFRYAFEARNYSMFTFAATASVYYLLELRKKFSKKNAALFVLFTTLGVYTHYYMFFVLAAEGLYILLFSAKGEFKMLLKMIGLYAVVGLLFAPWLPFLVGQVSSAGASYWIGPIGARTHYEALLRILGGEDQSIFRTALFWLSVGLLAVGIGHHILRRRFEKPYILIWLWAVVPFILASLPGLHVGSFKLPFRTIFFWRYLIGSSVPFSMVMVHSAQRLQKQFFAVSICVLVLLCVLIDWRTFFTVPYSFREVYKQEVLGKIKPADRIVTVLPSFAEVIYYRNRFLLTNEVIVKPEGLVQFSGKSLLDTYESDGIVKLGYPQRGRYFDFEPGPAVFLKKTE